MGVKICCDVEGCDSSAPPSGTLMSVPLGWFIVIVAQDEVSNKRKLVAMAAEAPPDGFFGFPMGQRVMPPRKVFVCGKHEMPKFKVDSGNEAEL